MEQRARRRFARYRLDEVMGCRETDVQTGPEGERFCIGRARTCRDSTPAMSCPGDGSRGRSRPLGRKRTWLRDSLAAAAVTSSHGQGRTLMLGSYIGGAHEKRREPAGARFCAALLARAGGRSFRPNRRARKCDGSAAAATRWYLCSITAGRRRLCP